MGTLSGPFAPDNLDRPEDWRRGAACDLSTAYLFHPDHSGTGPHYASEAKDICGRCPVRPGCLSWALGTREPYGVWGGLDEAERLELLATPPGAGAADGGAETPATGP